MTLGEKLTCLECTVHEFAKQRLDSAGLDPTLSELVMGNVYRRFQQDAYHASLLNQLAEANTPTQPEEPASEQT